MGSGGPCVTGFSAGSRSVTRAFRVPPGSVGRQPLPPPRGNSGGLSWGPVLRPLGPDPRLVIRRGVVLCGYADLHGPNRAQEAGRARAHPMARR